MVKLRYSIKKCNKKRNKKNTKKNNYKNTKCGGGKYRDKGEETARKNRKKREKARIKKKEREREIDKEEERNEEGVKSFYASIATFTSELLNEDENAIMYPRSPGGGAREGGSQGVGERKRAFPSEMMRGFNDDRRERKIKRENVTPNDPDQEPVTTNNETVRDPDPNPDPDPDPDPNPDPNPDPDPDPDPVLAVPSPRTFVTARRTLNPTALTTSNFSFPPANPTNDPNYVSDTDDETGVVVVSNSLDLKKFNVTCAWLLDIQMIDQFNKIDKSIDTIYKICKDIQFNPIQRGGGDNKRPRPREDSGNWTDASAPEQPKSKKRRKNNKINGKTVLINNSSLKTICVVFLCCFDLLNDIYSILSFTLSNYYTVPLRNENSFENEFNNLYEIIKENTTPIEIERVINEKLYNKFYKGETDNNNMLLIFNEFIEEKYIYYNEIFENKFNTVNDFGKNVEIEQFYTFHAKIKNKMQDMIYSPEIFKNFSIYYSVDIPLFIGYKFNP